MRTMQRALAALGLVGLMAAPALAGDLEFKDPSGDDFGPGSYKYPTDAVYKRGSFDLKKLEVIDKGSKIEFRATMGSRIEDPWDSKSWPEPGNGFSIQMLQIYIDVDGAEGSGFTDTLPGVNAQFGKADAWEKVVVISPQPTSRLKSEVSMKAGAMKKGVVIPMKTYAKGNKLIAVVKKKALGGSPDAGWRVQVVVQSNEGYPDKSDLLTRKVNEYEGQHRFGGGNDYDCDPHIIDILAGGATGDGSEKEAQKKALAYTCGDEGEPVKRATLPMIKPSDG